MGGCLLGDNLSWASTMFAYNSLPPDPEIVGASWREMWFQRLQHSDLWLEKWLRHQRRDDLRWWDHWLKGHETGIMQEPMLRAWMQDSVPPTTYYHKRPGRWVGEPAWPSPNIQPAKFRLNWPSLLEAASTPSVEQDMSIRSPLSVGLYAGKWCSYSATPDLPHDQREEDGGALVFTSHPLPEAIEILGAAAVSLVITSDQPVAMVAVRLSDVAADDKATRVTYGLLNLTHRDSREHPSPLKPGQTYTVNVKLNDVAYRFPKGHRLRLSLSTSYWPLAWAPPHPCHLTVRTGVSHLELPVRSAEADDPQTIQFDPPAGAAPPAKRQLATTEHNWRVIRDLAKDESVLEVVNDNGTVYFEDLNLEMQRKALEWYRFRRDDFNSVQGETLWERGFRRDDWAVKTITRTVMTSTPTHFVVHAELDAFESDRRVFAENWDYEIPRDLV